MNELAPLLNELLSFLLQLLTLFIGFLVAVLELIFHFAQTVVGSAR